MSSQQQSPSQELPARGTYNPRPSPTDSQSGAAESRIRDFMPGEMGAGWSDGYSFLENSKPIDHSYAFIDTKASSGIPSKEEFDIIQMQKCNGRTGGKKRSGDLNSKLEEYKKNRAINI